MMMAALATVNGEPGLLQMLAGKDVVVPATASAFGSAAIANTIAYGPEAGLKAGVFAAAFVFVGANIPGAMSPERIIAHAVLGCVQQASSGGQCGPGAAAAAFGKIVTGLTQGLGEAAQFAVTTVVGGTVSVIGGGKFANGAAQAGFGYLYNQATARGRVAGPAGGCRCGPVPGTGDHVDDLALSTAVDKEQSYWRQLDRAFRNANSSGPTEFQYRLVAIDDGLYENVRGGSSWLKSGATWKIGTSYDPEARYSAAQLKSWGVVMEIEYEGSARAVLAMEKFQLYLHFATHLSLPPGNRIFR
jgi:hypothetical protein